MSVNDQKGMVIGISAAVYEVIKLILNMILGGSFDIVTALIAVAAFLFTLTGLKYGNYVIAGLIAAIALIHLPNNISNISSNWIYLTEGLIDLGAAVVLCMNENVRDQFSNDLNDIIK